MKKIFAFLTAAVLLIGMASFAGAENGLTNADGFVYEIKDDGTAVIVGYTGGKKKLAIPETLDSVPVTEIGINAFYNQTKIQTVTVPGCIKQIGSGAFARCTNLTSAKIGEGVEELGDGIFNACPKLTELSLPLSVSRIESNPVSYCSKIKKIKIAKNHPYLEYLDGVLFTRPDHRLLWYPPQKRDKEYTVPDGTEIIGTFSFVESQAAGVTLPESVKRIEPAFVGCDALK